ncbi:MAG: phosphoenolpyruvate-utilizing N-terminal domain-containing protein, partial [Planctomycetia bacterium]
MLEALVERSLDAPPDSLLLLTLGEVCELVSNSHDLNETLSNIVRHIQQRFRTDVCSVYTMDRATGDMVLSATVGLRSDSVSAVRMPIHEGLTGLIAESKSAVATNDAPSHPRYRYFPETGEEEYPSFLGVPMIHGGIVEGVLVVQHRDRRTYHANEMRMLAGVAAQLAVLVINARLNRELTAAVHRCDEEAIVRPKPPTSELQGFAASTGSARGRAMRFEEFDFTNPALVARPAESVEAERERLQVSLEYGRRDIDRAARHLADILGDQFGALMQAQRLMLEDTVVQRDLLSRIDAGLSVEKAVVEVCGDYLRAYQQLDNPVFYERIYDVKDVFRRLLHRAEVLAKPTDDGDSVIVVGHEVSLLELFACDLPRVRGILVEKGGASSHVAILARSLGIPMLTNVAHVVSVVRDGDELFLDGDSAVCFINPEGERRRLCIDLIARRDADLLDDGELLVEPPLDLHATVNLLPEVARSVKVDVDAVGLFRSEFLELARRSFPTEEEQYAVYSKM